MRTNLTVDHLDLSPVYHEWHAGACNVWVASQMASLDVVGLDPAE
jgi:hypothetical protein